VPREEVEQFLLERPTVALRMLKVSLQRLAGVLEWQG
jgi:hypothetical protein